MMADHEHLRTLRGMPLRPAVSALILTCSALAWSLPAQAAAAPNPDITTSTWRSYANAITDAAVSRPGEVVSDLLVPVPGDARTQWSAIDGEQYLLVQKLSYRPISNVAPGEAFTMTSNAFVMVPGEMDEECARYGCARMNVTGLDMQVKQVLGLPPDADVSVVSRFWVRPADLIRPCTDVDPMSASCPQLLANTMLDGVDWASFLLEQAMYSWRMPRQGTPSPRVSCDEDYENVSRGSCYGFPWTRLGYTYDWTPGAKDDRGVTEFVVAEGSTVHLESTGTQRQYFPFRRSAGR